MMVSFVMVTALSFLSHSLQAMKYPSSWSLATSLAHAKVAWRQRKRIFHSNVAFFFHNDAISRQFQSCSTSITKFSSTRLNSSPHNENHDFDPYSEDAKRHLATLYHTIVNDESNNQHYFLSNVDQAHASLLRLAELVQNWNQRLNLVSRKEDTITNIYHRHILPSVALLPLILPHLTQQRNNHSPSSQFRIVDVGTGGGFPGLPLAILLPQVHFTLVDSVQKKLMAVAEMASELDLSNLCVHWGRVEEMSAIEKYDVVLGRSVTALPQFCAWVAHLLKSEEGKLIYITGGEVEDVVRCHVQRTVSVDVLLQRPLGTLDKCALVILEQSVRQIVEESGEQQNVVVSKVRTRQRNHQESIIPSQGKKLAKGEWRKKRNDGKKERGYEDFKRYEF